MPLIAGTTGWGIRIVFTAGTTAGATGIALIAGATTGASCIAGNNKRTRSFRVQTPYCAATALAVKFTTPDLRRERRRHMADVMAMRSALARSAGILRSFTPSGVM